MFIFHGMFSIFSFTFSCSPYSIHQISDNYLFLRIRILHLDVLRFPRIVPGIRARFWNAGHILGSASIEIELADHGKSPVTRLLFSGDIGPDNKLLHPDPDGPSAIDVLVMESTYGGRSRPKETPDERRKTLGAELRAALHRGGPIIIPSFAVERSQELLADLVTLMRRGEVPRIPVFLDSPLAAGVATSGSTLKATMPPRRW